MWWSISRLVGLLLLAFLLLIGSGGSDTAETACPANIEKADVFDIMQIYYFWNDEAEQQNKYLNLDLANFSNGNGLLDFLRYRPDRFDRNFTYITTIAEDDAFFDTGQVAAFGIGLREVTGSIWLTDVFESSPAAAAGLLRGDRIVAIDGRSISQIQSAGGSGAAFGPPEAGVTRTFDIEFADGSSGSVTLTKAVFSIDPVPDSRIQTYNVAGRVIGYLQLRSFVTSAENQLRAAFATLGNAGIQDLVIDLRYNGGGLLRTAQVLASLMAGPASPGLTFAELRFNSDLAADGFNDTLTFQSESAALELDNLVFITTDVSASASELVINGLEPYTTQLGFTVRIVGEATFGKPVGQGGVDYCLDPDTGELTQRLRVVAFETVNVDGEGAYFDGLPVDCAADDDVSLPLGDPAEASLATAIELIETDQCSAATSAPPFNTDILPGGIEIKPIRQSGGTAARLSGVW